MIVDRNQKIKEFTKEKYYMAHIKFDEMDAVTEHFQKKKMQISGCGLYGAYVRSGEG